MARLDEKEKAQLKAAAQRQVPRPPSMAKQPIERFVAFASFASQFKAAPKPVRFGGEHWKL